MGDDGEHSCGPHLVDELVDHEMAIRNTHERSETRQESHLQLQRHSSQWIEAIRGRQHMSANGGIEELKNVGDTFVDPPAAGHPGIRLITVGTPVSRNHVLTHLLSSIVEDQNSVTGLRIGRDRSSPLSRTPYRCLT